MNARSRNLVALRQALSTNRITAIFRSSRGNAASNFLYAFVAISAMKLKNNVTNKLCG